MIQIVKYNKPRSGSGAVSASGAGIALSSLAGLLTQQQLATILEGYLLKETFDDLFVKESDGHGGYRIKARYALYSNQYLSCLGNNPDAGTVALGATTLGGLNNVVAAADEVSAAAKVLVREAGAASWTLKSLSDIVGLDTSALATYLSSNGYAKQSWVEAKGYLTQQSLAGYATKTWVEAKGYLTAITKAQVEAVLTGNITSHTHSQYLTSALAAQTYQPIGDYATNTALNSAVSSLNTAIGQKLDAATFDDLFAKESDGHGGYRIKAKYALYSNQYLSCLGNNPDAGTTTPSTPGVDLDAVAEYLQQQGYATQAWVQAQGYLKAADLSAYQPKDSYVTYRPDMRISEATTAAMGYAYQSKDSAWYYGGGPAIKFGTGDYFAMLHVPYNGGTWMVNSHTPDGYTGWRQLLDSSNYAATLNSKYVTVDTAQTITGVKTLGTRVSTSTGNIDRLIIVPYKHTAGPWKINSYDDSNEAWLRFMYGPTETITFSNNGVFFANAIRKRGGTSAQFLKADGSVDGNTYLTAHQSLDYIRVLDTRNAETTTSMAQQLTAHFKGNDKIGLADGGLYTGLLHLQPWADASGGSAHDIAFTVNGNMWLRTGAIGSAWGAWRKVLDTNNYASVLDGRYVNASGDTMTGVLSIKTDTQPCLKLDSVTANKEVYMYIYSGGAAKNAIGWSTTYGAYIYNSPSSKYLGIKDNGTPHFQGNTLWHAGNDGSGSGLDADMLDGMHSSEFNRCASPSWTNGETVQAWAKRLGWANPTLYNETNWGWAYSKSLTIGSYTIDSQRYSALDFRRGSLNEAWKQKAIMFLPTYGDSEMIYIAQMSVSGTGGEVTLNAVRRYATYDTILASNVASATRLQGTYSLWGQSFYGNNVSGNMTGVGTINSAAAPINTIYASNWYRSIGATGWYNETYYGGWHMDNATWIKAWQKPVYIAYTTGEGANSFGVGLRCYHADHTSIEVQGGSYTMGLGCHSNGSWYWWRGTSSGKGYVMQYNGTTWAFNGVIKSSTGMYSDGYMSCLGQNTGSDARLKNILGNVTLPIEVILNAPAVRFAWNALAGPTMAGKMAVGTIAQYWLEPLPVIVGTMPTGYYGIDYDGLNWVAIHSVAKYAYDGLSDHERRIAYLERENGRMQKENQELRKQINELERRLVA